jgi:hypothetical protein
MNTRLFPLENSIEFGLQSKISGRISLREFRYGRKIDNDYFTGVPNDYFKSEKIIFEMRILQKVMKLQLLVVGKTGQLFSSIPFSEASPSELRPHLSQGNKVVALPQTSGNPSRESHAIIQGNC